MTMRERLILTIGCNAPGGLFEGDFDDLSPEHQALFRLPNRVKCESGTLGVWCLDCQFGDIDRELDWEFRDLEMEVADENPNL